MDQRARPRWMLVRVALQVAVACLGAESKLILGEVGQCVKRSGVPFVIGGDWNCDPAALGQRGWPQKLGAMIVSTGAGACRVGGGSQIDYFVVGSGIAGGVRGC